METQLPYSAQLVGLRVKSLRLALGFQSQGAFADAIGVKRGEVAAWECGDRRPSPAKAFPMAEKFGVTLDWLFYGRKSGLPYGLAEKLLNISTSVAA
jgi:transcriptional regulator with XRE-family HTH domain